VDVDTPENIQTTFSEYALVFKRYGKVLYGIYRPTENVDQTLEAVCAFLDLFMEERHFPPLTAWSEGAEAIKTSYLEFLLPEITEAAVFDLLMTRRFVVIQGPPGTGKTRMALQVLGREYHGQGQVVQFHPNTTYESFVGGLAPISSGNQLGVQFAPQPGYLMNAAKAAKAIAPKPYLLVIDEINRADLAKVMGEAIYLLESDDAQRPALHMPFDFGEPFGQEFALPANLHILGTMNSADRSIAILDVAIRRRFAFVDLWPQMRVVKALAGPLMIEAFHRLLSIFLEHSSDETLSLVPGHSYFLEKDDKMAAKRLKVHLRPLLDEYLAQGYVAGFSEQIRGFTQWLNSLPT
jgi:5-methylcytosine-specific restriction protein B